VQQVNEIICPYCDHPLELEKYLKEVPVAAQLGSYAVCHCARVIVFDSDYNIRKITTEEEIAMDDEKRKALDRLQEAARDGGGD